MGRPRNSFNKWEAQCLAEVGAECHPGWPGVWALGNATISKQGLESYTVRSPHGLTDRSVASGYDNYSTFGIGLRVLIECHIRNQINRNVTWMGKES